MVEALQRVGVRLEYVGVSQPLLSETRFTNRVPPTSKRLERLRSRGRSSNRAGRGPSLAWVGGTTSPPFSALEVRTILIFRSTTRPSRLGQESSSGLRRQRRQSFAECRLHNRA